MTVQYAKYFQNIFKTVVAFVSLTTFLFEEGREWEVAILAVLAVEFGGHSSFIAGDSMYGVLFPPTIFPGRKLLTAEQS